MSGSLMILAAAIVLGQAEANSPAPLRQLSWRVGEWKKELKDVEGKAVFVSKETATLDIRNEILVIRHTSEWTGRDDISGPGMTVMYWDPAAKSIKCWQYYAGKTVIQGSLVSANGNTLTWEMEITFGSGDFMPGSKGKYKVIETQANDGSAYSQHWTKVDGVGADEVGPIQCQRVK